MSKVMRYVRAFFRSYQGAAVGAALVVIFTALALSAPAWHHLAYDNNPAIRLEPPQWWSGGSGSHPLGTDTLGRDVLARIVTAIRISLNVAGAAVLVAGVIGVTVGMLAGYFGGWLDEVLMSATDTLLAIPLVLLAISVMAVLKPGVNTLIMVIAFTQWMTYARTARAETLILREQEYVLAAHAMGAPHRRILLRHILPGLMGSAIALGTLNVSTAVLLEAGLSYLGLGVQLPNPSLGSLLTEGRQYITRAPWLAIYPGIALMVLVLGINLLGDGLQAYLDPRAPRRTQ